MSRIPLDELRNRFLLLTVTLFFTLIVLEVPGAIGILDYRAVFMTPSNNEWEIPGRVFDDELLWRSQPHYQQRIKYTKGNIAAELCLPPGPEREYDLRYDQNGFRNDVDLETADIVVIGDSYVESPMMDHSLIMTTVLAQLQKKTVVNLGMAGYGSQQELIVFKRYVPQLHPKTVVWVFYGGNDLFDVSQYEGTKEMANTEGGLSKLWKRSMTRNLLSALSRLSRKCVPNNYYAGNYMVFREADGGELRRYFLQSNPKDKSSQLKELDVVHATFAEAYQLSRDLSVQFVVVYAPQSYRVYHDLSNVIEVSDEVKGWELSDLPDRIGAMLADISPDIAYLDLTPVLRHTTEKGIRTFLEDDTHWTQEGHRIVSEAISDVLNSHPLNNLHPLENR